MNNKIAILLLIALAVLILWRLSTRVPSAVSFSENAMIWRQGQCTLAIPLKKIRRSELAADDFTIIRTYATLYNGYTLVDEKVTLPLNRKLDKALEALVGDLFSLKNLRKIEENGKMVLFEGVTKEEKNLWILVIFKGKTDLELLYPIHETFVETVRSCLLEGRAHEGPVVLNATEGEEKSLPLADWDRLPYAVDNIVNKDM